MPQYAILGEYEHTYFIYELTEQTTFTISAMASFGDPDIFVAKGYKPSFQNDSYEFCIVFFYFCASFFFGFRIMFFLGRFVW